jgi:hypothetical protein
MRNLPILSVIAFLLGGGSGCIASPNSSVQLSAKPTNTETVRPRISPNPIKNPSPSPFVPGVSLPIFPGISPTTTSSPLPTPTTPVAPILPLVEVPTPGLRATKVKTSSTPPSSTTKRRKVVVDKTPSTPKQRLKRREN